MPDGRIALSHQRRSDQALRMLYDKRDGQIQDRLHCARIGEWHRDRTLYVRCDS